MLENENLNEPLNSQLNIGAVSGSNFRLAMYALTKIGMLYCIFNTEWLALSGFTIATIYTYIDMMSNNQFITANGLYMARFNAL